MERYALCVSLFLRCEMGKICVICGKPSGMYPLCREHLKMKTEGKVIKCEDCGTWHLSNKPCPVCSEENETEISFTGKKGVLSTQKPYKKCLLCDNEVSDDFLFCKSCYFKYKDKSITVNIKNLSEFNIVDEYGNRDVKTQNGMLVRSQQEKIIYDELYSRKIRCEYETTVFYKNDKGETKTLHPDFYLPDYDLYIEHWGYENAKDPRYKEEKLFKQKIYQSQGKKIAGTSSEDIKDIKAAIDKIFFENDIKI